MSTRRKNFHRPGVAVLGCTLATLLAALACGAFGDLSDEQACHDIPKGGCPGFVANDGNATANCADPSCSALYSCQTDGGWNFIADCPVVDAGPDRLPVPDARVVEASRRRDVDFDVPPGASGGPGCIALQQCQGDCPLSVGIACPEGQCCGCCEFYVCDDGGWNDWGYCDEGGALVPSPKLEGDD
jgi:hypothetical protein